MPQLIEGHRQEAAAAHGGKEGLADAESRRYEQAAPPVMSLSSRCIWQQRPYFSERKPS